MSSVATRAVRLRISSYHRPTPVINYSTSNVPRAVRSRRLTQNAGYHIRSKIRGCDREVDRTFGRLTDDLYATLSISVSLCLYLILPSLFLSLSFSHIIISLSTHYLSPLSPPHPFFPLLRCLSMFA